jgi:chloride channel 7
MLSGDQDLPDGIGMARLAWTRLPTAEGAAPPPLPEGSASASAARDELFVGAVESLDYEVIENYAYREEQVRAPFRYCRALLPCSWLRSVRVRFDEFVVCVGCVLAGAAEQVLGALLHHAQVVLRPADRRR